MDGKLEDKIFSIISSLRSIDIIKNRYDLMQNLEAVSEKLKDDTFKIAVTGEFSSGKSTFINAIIGKDVLLHAVDETTAAITSIHNVKKTDPRSGTGRILYADGKSMQFDDFSELRTYTTTVSEIDVASKIREVELYLNFLDVDYPLTIVDTPGLNGVADKHRDITIEEIRKAHACIYLLSIKGITASDLKFVRILKSYQSEFIFVQNFIDELKETEGETPQKKKDTIQESLATVFLEQQGQYTISAVSALLALAGKDRSIQYLYAGDTEKIKDSDREGLYKKSNFPELESILKNYFVSGAYKKVILESVLYSLETVIQWLLPELYHLDEQSQELLQSDSRSEVIQKAKKRLERIEKEYELNKKKINNFIISRDKENRIAYKKEIARSLTQVYDKISDKIDKEIRGYDDFDRIEGFSGKNPGEYFSGIVSKEINTNVLPELNENLKTGYQVLYSDALLRAAEYARRVGISGNQNLSLVKVLIKSNLNIRYENKLIEIEQDKVELKGEMERISALQKEIQDTEVKKQRKGSEIEVEEIFFQSKKDEYERKKSQLGPKPDICYNVQKERTVKREGIIGFFKDIFAGPKKVSYEETVEDRSKFEVWKRESDELNSKFQLEMLEHDRKTGMLKNKLRELENKSKQNQKQYEKSKGKIESLKKDIKAKEYEYQTYTKNARGEYCKSQKKKLKDDFHEILLDEDNSESKLVRFKDKIDQVSEENIPQIQQLVIRSFEDETRRNKERLNYAISENTQELKKQYDIQKKDIEKLESIGREINNIRRNNI